MTDEILLIIADKDENKQKAFINEYHTFYKTGLIQGLLELTDEYINIDDDIHKVVRINVDISYEAAQLYFSNVDINENNMNYDLLKLMMLAEDDRIEQLIMKLSPKIIKNEFDPLLCRLVHNTFEHIISNEMVRQNVYFDTESDKFMKFDENSDLALYKGSCFSTSDNNDLLEHLQCISNDKIMIVNPCFYSEDQFIMMSDIHKIEINFRNNKMFSNAEINYIKIFQYNFPSDKHEGRKNFLCKYIKEKGHWNPNLINQIKNNVHYFIQNNDFNINIHHIADLKKEENDINTILII
mgnify:CR=1 FL=1